MEVARRMEQEDEAERRNSELCSSKEWKVGLLEKLVRWSDARSILEIGTAYGRGTVGLALSQTKANVVTVEMSERRGTIGARNIASVTEGVDCRLGMKQDVVPVLVKEGKGFDFVFHDGGHKGDDYVSDFDMIHPILEPGSLYVIDDIYWDDGERRQETKATSRLSCREGWEKVVADDRVDGAVTYKSSVGILLVR